MKKEYNVAGLDCANCALTLEKYLQRIDGITECSINFTTNKMYLDIESSKYKEVIKDIARTIKQVNPDVTISEEKQAEAKTTLYDNILYIIGTILGVIVIFVPLHAIAFYSLLVASALCLGYKTYLKAILQLRKFKVNENTLITISIIGAIAVGESMEGLMVIALYTLGKMLEAKAVNHSRKSISALISTHPEYAYIKDEEREKKVKPEAIKVGDILVVKAGEKVAVDGIVVEGNGSVDKRHLTGESFPVLVNVGDTIESGSIVLDSVIYIQAICEYKDSTISKILNLVSDATNKKSKTETFISKFASYYTYGVMILSLIVGFISWLVLKDVSVAVYRGLIFLVVSCPCAFAISVPLSYFSGIGRCSKDGILIKGSNYLDTCAKLNKIIFDKTGTLTTGDFQVKEIRVADGYNVDEILDIVVAGEKNSHHPVALAICKYYGKNSKVKIKDFKETAGKGIEYLVGSDQYFVGKQQDNSGFTVVSISKNNEEIAKICLEDNVKYEARGLIQSLSSLNVKTMMLTGDCVSVARNISKQLELDEFEAELLPEDKFRIVEEEKKKGVVGFVGDGLNDTPALALSDVGVGMGIMGSQATLENSDVVIADDNISKITNLIEISKYTKKIVWQNILFAGITKFTFLLLGSLGITGMLFAVFADVGVTLLAILNSIRVLSFKTKKPKK